MPRSGDKWDIKSTDFQKECQNYIDSDIMQWGIPEERLKKTTAKKLIALSISYHLFTCLVYEPIHRAKWLLVEIWTKAE